MLLNFVIFVLIYHENTFILLFLIMMKTLFFLCFLPGVLLSFGQSSDDTRTFASRKHFFAVNPINSALLQQAGLQYEYKPGRFGFALDAGGIYANKWNYSRIFMAATSNHGPFEFYSGYYTRPQINFYLNEANNNKSQSLPYKQAKFIYKHLEVDTTHSHVWYNLEGADQATYRKQFDNTNMMGAFLGLGFKQRYGRFYYECGAAFGVMNIHQDLIVYKEYDHSPPIGGYPYYDELTRQFWTASIDVRVGYIF